MALSLSAAAIFEKNRLRSDGAWLLLLTIVLPDTTTIRVCRNTDDVIWPAAGGDTYVAFPFTIDEIGDSSKNEVPSFTVKVSNVTKALQPYLQAANGGTGATVTLRVVHSAHLDLTSAEVELTFEVTKAASDEQWVTFTLGTQNIYTRKFPRSRVEGNFCRYRAFKGARCGYSGSETECNRTLTRCRELGNSTRFGNAPGVGGRGIVI
ncbi:MAG: DUF1833 family protein [Pseudomonadota bacterium]